MVSKSNISDDPSTCGTWSHSSNLDHGTHALLPLCDAAVYRTIEAGGGGDDPGARLDEDGNRCDVEGGQLFQGVTTLEQYQSPYVGNAHGARFALSDLDDRLVSLFRKSMKDVVFSNGTVIPAGTIVVATSTGTHLQEELYEDAADFKPFRFSDVREKGGPDAQRQQFHTPAAEYISFGHGYHAWYVHRIVQPTAFIPVTWITIQLWEMVRCSRSEGDLGVHIAQL